MSLKNTIWSVLDPGNFLGQNTENAEKAEKAQEDANNAAMAFQEKGLAFKKKVYKQGVARQQPFLDAANRAIPGLETMAKDYGDRANAPIESSPEYDYMIKNVGKSLAARGIYNSGAGIEAESNIAAQDYWKRIAYKENLLSNKTGILQGIAGQNPTSNMNATAENASTNISNIFGNMGDTALREGAIRGSFYAGQQTQGQNTFNKILSLASLFI